METETWKPVVGYEGRYEVSSLGNVKSMNYKNSKNELLLKPGINTRGYKMFDLLKKYYLCHRLVAIAFIPNPNNLPIVMHLDNNKLNNNVTNLKWGTHKENTKQAIDDGLMGNHFKYHKYSK